MAFRSGLIAAALVASALATPAPMMTPAPRANQAVERGTSCTFSGSNGAASASKSQADCATIVLSDVAVPSGTTLDLSDLNDGTSVIFEGETTWGYKEWEGPLLQIKGKQISISGADGAVLNANGDKWWDGEGSNGGKTKPKFFYVRLIPSKGPTHTVMVCHTNLEVMAGSRSYGFILHHQPLHQEHARSGCQYQWMRGPDHHRHDHREQRWRLM